MQNENPPMIKALTPGELAVMYGVSTRTLQTWINMHAQFVGKRCSKYFTSLQVKKIYDCIGLPLAEYKEIK